MLTFTGPFFDLATLVLGNVRLPLLPCSLKVSALQDKQGVETPAHTTVGCIFNRLHAAMNSATCRRGGKCGTTR